MAKRNYIIAIDAGHGRNTSGKRCDPRFDAEQTREWVLNDRVATYLQQLLNINGMSYVRVDDQSGVNDVSLTKRCQIANNAKADFYISIHHNAGINGGTGGGTLICYYPTGERKSDASLMYRHVVTSTGLVGNRAQSVVERKDLSVLKATAMPALLLENGFMDSATDVPIILNESHARHTAQGLYDFICSRFNILSDNNKCAYCGK